MDRCAKFNMATAPHWRSFSPTGKPPSQALNQTARSTGSVTLGKLANMTSGPPQTDNYQSLTKTK